MSSCQRFLPILWATSSPSFFFSPRLSLLLCRSFLVSWKSKYQFLALILGQMVSYSESPFLHTSCRALPTFSSSSSSVSSFTFRSVINLEVVLAQSIWYESNIIILLEDIQFVYHYLLTPLFSGVYSWCQILSVWNYVCSCLGLWFGSAYPKVCLWSTILFFITMALWYILISRIIILPAFTPTQDLLWLLRSFVFPYKIQSSFSSISGKKEMQILLGLHWICIQ